MRAPHLLPVQLVATEKPFATRSLAIPMPISPIDRMPTVASLEAAIVMRFLLSNLAQSAQDWMALDQGTTGRIDGYCSTVLGEIVRELI